MRLEEDKRIMARRQTLRSQAHLGLFVFLVLVIFLEPAGSREIASSGGGDPDTAIPEVTFAELPLYFVENGGQTDDAVSFLIEGADKTIFFAPDGLTFALAGENRERWTVKLEFVDANPTVRPRGEDRAEAVFSYFRGKPDEWKTGISSFRSIVYEDLWPGIDLVYRGTVDRLKYEFVVAPGADPERIRLAYRGVSDLRVLGNGALEVVSTVGNLKDATPVAYQAGDGTRREVGVRYSVTEGKESFGYSFEIDEFDRARPLIIDPEMLIYCGFISGMGNDTGAGIAVDADGFAYVTGTTDSWETWGFPVTVGPDLTYNGDSNGAMKGDAFVAKIQADGTGLVYCGYIGGAVDDGGHGIAVDAEGYAYVAGWTNSDESSFPVVVGPDLTFNATIPGAGDAFVAKVNPSGTALVYCGYVGGDHGDGATDIAVDGMGRVYVVGNTMSDETTFPVTIGPDLTFNDTDEFDAFVARVNSGGTALEYCGYIGGERLDVGMSIAIDPDGNAYVVGRTSSDETTFPVLVGPDLTYAGSAPYFMPDAYIAKINPSGAALVYSGYIGGWNWDEINAVAVDATGRAHVAGHTRNDETDFPVAVGPDLTYNDGGAGDAFVGRLNSAGTGLEYCGYIGAESDDWAWGVAIDVEGNAYVTGFTYCNDGQDCSFPEIVGPDLTFNGFNDAWVAKVASSGSSLVYCGYIGGEGGEEGRDIAVDSLGNAYLVGFTYSNEDTFPVVVGPGVTADPGTSSMDAWVAKVNRHPDTPWNDNCANAFGMGEGATAYTTIGATTDGPEEPELCGFSGDIQVASDVWYYYIASASGTVTVSLCGSDFDTKLAIYDGPDCPTETSAIACNDDSCGLQSEVTFYGVAGYPYLIRIGGYNGATGSGTLTVTLEPDDNDDCLDAIPAYDGSTPFSNLGATTDGPDEPGICDFFGYTQIDSDIWFSYTASASGILTVSLCGSSYDTKMAVYDGPACPVTGSAIACNDDFCDLQSEVSLPVVVGNPYLIRIGGYGGAQGSGILTISVGPYENDDCAFAAPAYDGTTPFSNFGATTDGPDEPGRCDFSGDTQIASDVWYLYQALSTGGVTVSLCGSDYDTKMAVYEGPSCPTTASAIACNDDACGLQSELTFFARGGDLYLIRIGGYLGEQGSGTLTITSSPSAIDACQGIDGENVLMVNGDTGTASAHVVFVDGFGPIDFSIVKPSGGGTGKFCVHLNDGAPTADTIVSLPADLGPFCHELLFPRGADPLCIWNNVGKTDRVGTSNYFGNPIPNPARAPVTFQVLPAGDPVNLPVGTVWTLQALILNPLASSWKPGSVTNAIVIVIL